MSTEPAFPLNELDQYSGNIAAQHFGLSLHDYFAAKAMQAALAGATLPGVADREPEVMKMLAKLGDACYAVSDAMVEARVRHQSTGAPT